MEAVFSYYFGGGTDLDVPFNVIDQGYGVSDFSGFKPCNYGVGTYQVGPYRKDYNLLTLSTLDISGPGRIVFSLNGSLIMRESRKWEFSGILKAEADKFNFDPTTFGPRDGSPNFLQTILEKLLQGPFASFQRYRPITYPQETITRIVHDLDQTPLHGKEFHVNIVGSRQITGEGCCEK